VNALLIETKLPSGQILQIVQGDITVEKTDAIVNAANKDLMHEAGVAGAILRRGGPVIQQESDAWVQNHGPVSHTEPAWTSGGNLNCRFVIHAVGPVWGDTQRTGAGTQRTGAGTRKACTGEDEDVKLAAAVSGALRVADELGLGSIAFPAISTGIYGFPKERAAGVMFKSIREYFFEPSGLKLVRLVLYDSSTITIFEKVWHDYFDPKP
jgi:O-acetyl-ADP-ribose deacetylase (regulator of RNase III)